MIYTFDKKTRYTNKYFTTIIPFNADEEINNDYEVLDELSYKKAPNYKQMSIEEIRNFISDYYNDVLSQLDPKDVARELRCSVLISDERSDSLALRHIVSEWLNIYTDERVIESYIDKEGKFVELERPNFIRPMLEEIIKNAKESMHGFQSLRAAYLFEKSEELESKANLLEEKTGDSFEHLRQIACYLKCDACKEEEKYNKENVYKESYTSRRKYKRQVKWKF